MTDRPVTDATMVLAAGTTDTATIPGISAAGADPEGRRWTPTADAEVLTRGEPVRTPALPRSPTGCPTPAVVTRAVRELVEFEATVLDAGLLEEPATTVRDVTAKGDGDGGDGENRDGGDDEGDGAGGDPREAEPVPTASAIYERARSIGATIDAERVLLAESVPGGTTTAMGVLAALGERTAVSSSLPENPIERKRSVVEAGLAESDLERGDLEDQPLAAVRRMGDPVLATLAGVATGLFEGGPDGTTVTLAGGTQLACVGALLRHAGIDGPLELATTSYVADDDSAAVDALATGLDLELRVTDPGFEAATGGLARFAAGEAKEGVGMGGALALAADHGVSMTTVRERSATVLDRCLAEAR